MRLFIIYGLTALALPVATGSAEAEMTATKSPAHDLPRARDGNVAIAQELDAARRAGTVAAYDLFLARHPSHALAEVARRERNTIARPRGSAR
jgi:hypothetical protein